MKGVATIVFAHQDNAKKAIVTAGAITTIETINTIPTRNGVMKKSATGKATILVITRITIPVNGMADAIISAAPLNSFSSPAES
jgi:hypothetical protein